MDSEELISELTGILLDERCHLSLAELSRACAVHAEHIIQLVDEGVLAPVATEPDWRFTGTHVRRARVAIRLQRDLGVNLPGVALALQLLDELEALRGRPQYPGVE